MMSPRIFRPLLIAALLLAAPAARAQGSSPAGGATKSASSEASAITDKARQLYVEGLAALNAGRWAEAHAALLAAWRIHQHWQVASNLGLAELKLGKHRDAAEHLSFYLREAPSTKVEERRKADAALKEALARVGSVTLHVVPEGAEVAIDGALVGAAPLSGPVFLEPGEHAITARLDGYVRARVTVTASAGGSQEVTVRMLPEVAGAPAAATPAAPAASSIDAPTSPEASPQVVEEEGGARGPNKVVLIAGAATAGVATGVGVVLAVIANGKAGDADDQAAALEQQGGADACAGGQRADACAALSDARASAAGLGNAAVWTFIGAGVVGVGTLAYWLVTPRSGGRGAIEVKPIVGAQGGGLLVGGVW